MRKASCDTCGSNNPAADMFVLSNKPICRPCAEKQAQDAVAAGREIELGRIVDPTICGMCNADYGSGELPFVGGSPVCSNCSSGLYERPYPNWLKLSLAGLLLFLAGSLWRGLPYFRAGRHLVLAERAMDKQDYQKAHTEFAEVLKSSPTEQKVVLLGAKANLMAGDVEGAQKFLNLRQQYESNELFAEVNAFWKRALDAFDKASRAGKLANADQDEDAARLMHEASAEYPQSQFLAETARSLDGGVAFDHKDYDGFLRLSQVNMEESPGEPGAVATVASALACKYAVTGDPNLRRQTEEMLEKARALAHRSPEDMASFTEYAERIQYRLDSREIISRPEYDRRFRQKEAKR
jgi:hypothetical protein